jgi:hypothetical protein
MQALKLAFVILFASGAVFAWHVIIGQIQQSLQQGYWRGRTGVAYRATSQKTFWFGMCVLSIFAAGIAIARGILLIAAIFQVGTVATFG